MTLKILSRTARRRASAAIWRSVSTPRACSAAMPKLVLHGGGNTSLKARVRDRLGEEADVLYVKSSGSDMAKIDADGFVAVRLEPMRKLRALESIGDEDLVAIERANLIDAKAANPSVEMMLHAFLPHKFIDHTHATAVLSLIDQPDGEQKCAEVLGGRLRYRGLPRCRGWNRPKNPSKSSSEGGPPTASSSVNMASSPSAKPRTKRLSSA